MSNKILVYIDPGFRLGRHYVNMAETMSAECVSRGIQLLHYVGAGVPDNLATKYGLVRIFNNGCGPPPESSTSFFKDARAILDNLINYTSRNSKVIFYMYCGHMGHFTALAELLAQPQYESIDIKFYMNLSYQDLNCGQPAYEYAEDLKDLSESLDSCDKSCRIVGIMDNQQSIKRYQPCFNRTLKLMPIPLYYQRPEPNGINRDSKKLTIGYFGQLIKEQGYLLATQVYEEFIEKRDKDGLQFLMRVNDNKSTKELARHFEDFRKKTKRLRIVKGFLETHEYFKMISECDIVILPYLKEYYPYRTSGVLLDALIHGKVVVVPHDTWMSEIIEKHGSGCIFKSGDLMSLISAVDCVTKEYSSYAALASRNIAELYSQFSAASLLDLLFGEQSCSLE